MSRISFLALNEKTAEGLLAVALPQFCAAQDGAKSAKVYRLSRGGLILWQSSDSSAQPGQFLALEANSPYQQAISTKEILVNGQDVLVPLLHLTEVFALLLLEFSAEPKLDSLAENAQELSLVLYQRQLEALFTQQIDVTTQLNSADSLQDVAAVLAKTILQPEQYIAIIVFEENAKGRVVVTANRRQVYNQNIPTEINPDAVKTFYELLEKEGEALITDSNQDERHSTEARKWLQEQKVFSMYMLPLLVTKRLYGFIGLVDTVRSLAPSPLERQLYRNISAQASSVIEKKQFLEDAERMAASSEEARSLQLLNRLIATANTANNEAPILAQTSEALLEVTGVDHVGIVLIENERGFVVSEAPIKGILGFEVESGAGSIAELVKNSRKPLVVANIEEDTQMPVEARKVMVDLGIHAVIIIPMFDLDGHLLGTVGLDYYSRQARINPGVVELAQTFVSQVALSLQKLRLLANSQQQANQLQKVTNFGQALRSHLGIAEIVGTALRYSNDLLEAHYVGILIYEGRQLKRVGTWWQKKSQVDVASHPINAQEDNIALKVLESLELQNIPELQAEWQWKHPYGDELQSFIAAPLLSAGKLLGVLEVANTQARAYNAVDMAAFQQMGNQLAVALSNAEAYAQSQKLAQHKSLANDIITKLQRQADVSEILQVTVQELGQALGAKRGRIRLGTGEKKP